MERTPTLSRRYGLAVGSMALALLVIWVLRPLPTPLPGLLLLLAVLGSTAYGGLGPGLVATVCALFGLHVLFLPVTEVQIVPITHGRRLGLFGVLAGTGCVLLAGGRLVTVRLRRLNAELEARVAERTATLTQAHAALAASEARYRELVENARDSIYTHDLQGYFTSVNTAAERLSGYTRAEALQMHIAQVVVPEHLARANQTTERQLAGETPPPYELEIQTKAGRRVPVELHTRLILQGGQPVGIQGIARDISERKQLEATLEQERDVLRVTLSSIGDAVIATDTTATVTFLNPMAETLTGWSAQDALGRPIAEIFPILNEQTRQAVENPVDKVLREGGIVGLANHTVLVARDGREVPIADSGAPIRGPSGQVYGTVLVFRDITERKQAEAALVQAKDAAEEAAQLKSEFLATMSHELRTPLHVILGYTDMLMEEAIGELAPEHVEILRRIERNSRVLFELISMVLDLNRLEAGRLPVEVKEVQVPEVLAELKAEMQGLCDLSGLPWVWQVAAGLPALHTDPGKLKVVMKNLLSNAVKFTQAGGITVAAEERRGGVELRVTDTGIGIPVEAQALIFEPFRQVDGSDTRRYAGSGLGLHIVQRLLEVLGGTITVESELGQGSTFRVWLPTGEKERTLAGSGDARGCSAGTR
jgi:PAS domain S-box-containing protein